MFKEFTETFKKPNVRSLAERELQEAEKHLLAAHTSVEYAQSQVVFRTNQVRRLTAYLAK